MDEEVVIFCQTEIVKSGLVLDEDLVFIQMVEPKAKRPVSGISRRIIFLTTAACTTLWAIRRRDPVIVLSTGIVFIVPAATSLLLSFFHKRKLDKRNKYIINLLSQFRNLSRIHSEVTDFLKCFSFSADYVNNPDPKLSEEIIFDLSKSTCDLQVRITNEMQKVISQIHAGLRDVSLDLTEFEKATAVQLTHESFVGCLRNCNFVEGQVVLLRSHLLTSLFLVSSPKGNQTVFLKVLDEVIPPFENLLRRSIEEIKISLNKHRLSSDPPVLSLVKIENVFTQKKMVFVPRLRKHVLKINDRICCTFIKLRELFGTLENVQDESQMMSLQQAISTLTNELHRCYLSAADLEKLIQSLNRNFHHVESQPVVFVPKTNLDQDKPIGVENDEPIDDSDYQVFSSGICEDDNEGHAVRFYKRFMKNDVDWIAELKQSDEFQRRQTKFHTSTPLEPLSDSFEGKESFTTALSMAVPSSEKPFMVPPPPPPMPIAFPMDLSNITTGISTLPDTPESSSSKESSSSSILHIPEGEQSLESTMLLDSLKGALDRIGKRDEEEFE